LPRRATIAVKLKAGSIPSVGNVQITEPFDFLKESADEYSRVGFGAKINGVATPVKFDEPELLYQFPITFDDTYTSTSVWGAPIPTIGYYGQTVVRNSTVDGWGQLITPYGTFQVYRVKSVVNITDTIHNGTFGFKVPRQPSNEYRWLLQNKGLQLLLNIRILIVIWELKVLIINYLA